MGFGDEEMSALTFALVPCLNLKEIILDITEYVANTRYYPRVLPETDHLQLSVKNLKFLKGFLSSNEDEFGRFLCECRTLKLRLPAGQSFVLKPYWVPEHEIIETFKNDSHEERNARIELYKYHDPARSLECMGQGTVVLLGRTIQMELGVVYRWERDSATRKLVQV